MNGRSVLECLSVLWDVRNTPAGESTQAEREWFVHLEVPERRPEDAGVFRQPGRGEGGKTDGSGVKPV